VPTNAGNTITLTSGYIPISGGNLTINGPGAEKLAISGNKTSPIFNLFDDANQLDLMAGKALTINRLTLKDGYNSDEEYLSGGGAIRGDRNHQASLLTIDQCVVTGNSHPKGMGGAFFTQGGTLIIKNSILTNNSAAHGGAIASYWPAFVESYITLQNTTVSYNSATVEGGGIVFKSMRTGRLLINNSTVFGNGAPKGGGILSHISGDYDMNPLEFIINNSTVSGNTATTGGGIHFVGCYKPTNKATIANSIVAGNQAVNGKEIYRDNSDGPCSIAGADSSLYVTLDSLGYNLFGEYDDPGVINFSLLNSDKKVAGPITTALGPLANNGGPTQTLLPVTGSPAIDAGSNALIPTGFTTDQRGDGFPRIFGSTVDIGAVEVGPPPPSNVSAVGVFRAGSWFLDANANGAWDGCQQSGGLDLCLFGSFGQAGDYPVAGNWNSGANSSFGVLRASTGEWFLDFNGNFQWDNCNVDRCYTGFGQTGDLPVAGDWTGNGFAKIGLFRKGQWLLDGSGNGVWEGCNVDICLSFGQAGDLPVAGNWSGGTKAGAGVFRAGTWYLDYNGNGAWDGCQQNGGQDVCLYNSFGVAGDLPAAGDWNGDGKAKVGVFRAGTWYLDYNGNGAWDGCGVDKCYEGTFGINGDLPVAGKWQ